MDDALKPAYLIFGSDQPKVRRSVARLRNRVRAETDSDLNISSFTAPLDKADAVLDAANSPTFTFGTRLLLVNAADKWAASERDKVVAYLGDPLPGVCIALVGDAFKKTEKLYKLLARGDTQVLEFTAPRHEKLGSLVRTRARAHGLRIGPHEAEYLVSQVGDDVGLLEQEIAKLSAYTRGQPVAEADIDTLCAPSIDARIYELTDAVGARDEAAAFRVLEGIYAQIGRSGSDTAMGTLYALIKYVGKLLAAFELPGAMPPAEVARTLGMHPFAAKKLVRQRDKLGRTAVQNMAVALAEAQADMVAQSSIEAEFVLEIALDGMFDPEVRSRRGLRPSQR